jgi:hypothetical protein
VRATHKIEHLLRLVDRGDRVTERDQWVRHASDTATQLEN